MKKLIVAYCCFLLLFLQCSGKSIIRAETTGEKQLNLHARAAVLLDGSSGRVLYENGGSKEKLPMASTTKIMTCILVLEQGDIKEFAEVSSYAQSMPKVHLTVRQGEYYKVLDLLYSLMLESHNDSAVVLAEHIGGSVEGFAELMNEKAKEIGCGNTNFVTPNGLDHEDHYTTAEELAKIMRYCINISEKKEEFLEITRTGSYTFTNYLLEEGTIKEGQRTFTVSNKNAFLSMMEGALSGKTGFTSGAGYCYVGALKRDGKCLIVALLACGWPNNKGWKWEDTKKLMEYGLTSFEYKTWFEPPKLPALTVFWGKYKEDENKAVEEKLQKLVLPKGKAELIMGGEKPKESQMLLKETDTITMRITLPKSLTAPVKKGMVIGMVSYYLNGEIMEMFPIMIGNSIEKVDFQWVLTKLFKLYCL